MGKSRIELQTLLENLLGSRNVYFQPPSNLMLKYPCIVYQRGTIDKTTYANDNPYQHTMRYSITIIDQNPDSEISQKIASLPMCIYERHFASDGLNHDIYNLYY